MIAKRESKVVITFPTTTSALEAERLLKKAKLQGRLIPVPVSISAGCGLAWCAPLDCADAVTELLEAEKVKIEGVFSMEL